MACFLVPAAEAVVTTIAEKASGEMIKGNEEKHPFLSRLNWLNNMLWGGTALLAFEHVWHGEVTPWFPFLTAAADPGSTLEMLREMLTSGTAMAALVTAVWAVMAAAAKKLSRSAVSGGKEK